MESKSVNCSICGQPYQIHAYYCGDQSCCGGCRTEIKRRLNEPTELEKETYEKRRDEFFGGRGRISWSAGGVEPTFKLPDYYLRWDQR